MLNLTPSLSSLELFVFVSVGVLRSAIRNPQPAALATQALGTKGVDSGGTIIINKL